MLTERINKFQQDLITKFDTIMAASILQGVVAPCFLKKWVYDVMFLGLSAELEPSVNDITASEMRDVMEKVHVCKRSNMSVIAHHK